MNKAATKALPARKRRVIHRPSSSYLDLIAKFPLRPLRDAADYDAAVRVLDSLAIRSEETLDSGEQDYLDTLTMLVESFDDEHYAIETKHLRPIDMLKYLMEQSGMRTTDLGELLGNRGLASLILNGQRQLSKAHIRLLADHFKVSPGLFL